MLSSAGNGSFGRLLFGIGVKTVEFHERILEFSLAADIPVPKPHGTFVKILARCLAVHEEDSLLFVGDLPMCMSCFLHKAKISLRFSMGKLE